MSTIDQCPDYIATYALAIEMARDGDERVRAFFRGECGDASIQVQIKQKSAEPTAAQLSREENCD